MDFKEKLIEAFNRHIFMKDRKQHTINELLYVLDTDELLDGDDYNISIKNLAGEWLSIMAALKQLLIRTIAFQE